MADTAISGLTEITTLLDPDADFVEVVDTSAGASGNRKIKPRRFARWELAASWTFSVNVTSVEFTNLSAYSELYIMYRNLQLGTSGNLGFQVSSDNGSTWKTTVGEYSAWDNTGTASDVDGLYPIGTAHTSAPRSGSAYIIGWNLAQPKPVIITRSVVIGWAINDAEACNAIRAIPNGGGNMTAGSIYIFGR